MIEGGGVSGIEVAPILGAVGNMKYFSDNGYYQHWISEVKRIGLGFIRVGKIIQSKNKIHRRKIGMKTFLHKLTLKINELVCNNCGVTSKTYPPM